MRKKVIIALIIFSSIFVIGGIYIVISIETATSKLNNLLTLHKVEILREQLLINIRSVQTDISFKEIRYPRGYEKAIKNVRDMERVADSCFKCHHSHEILKRLLGLRSEIERYKDVISRVLTIRANRERLAKEEERAFLIGDELSTTVNNMINLTNIKLKEKTRSSIEEIARTKVILYILVSVVPILVAGLGYLFIRGFTEPVKILLNATRKLKDGNLDYRVTGLKDEFGEVASSFNEMSTSLKEQMIRMQHTEQMMLLGELAAGLAHEIKNPLAGIKGSVEVLLKEVKIPEDYRADIVMAAEEIRRIETLLKNLLNFAKPAKPQLISMNVNDFLDKTLNFSLKHLSIPLDTSAKIEVEKDFGEDIPEIMADPMQMQQAFLNLILNSKDVMPNGGKIIIKTSYDQYKRNVIIEMSDTGGGIDEGVMDKIFQPFFTTKSKGTGLGLAITKRLIQQHGGSIGIERDTGVGVKFSISLPVDTG